MGELPTLPFVSQSPFQRHLFCFKEAELQKSSGICCKAKQKSSLKLRNCSRDERSRADDGFGSELGQIVGKHQTDDDDHDNDHDDDDFLRIGSNCRPCNRCIAAALHFHRSLTKTSFEYNIFHFIQWRCSYNCCSLFIEVRSKKCEDRSIIAMFVVL